MIPAIKSLLQDNVNLAGKTPLELVQYCNTTDFSYYKDIPIKWFEILVTSLGCKSKVPDYIWELEKINLQSGWIREDLREELSDYDFNAVKSAGTAYENWAQHFLGRPATIEDFI